MVAVEGDFDDCQRLVKSMFAEEEMKALLRYFCILHYAFCLLIVIPCKGTTWDYSQHSKFYKLGSPVASGTNIMVKAF